jgi:tripartite-type tricarboxylate transporter receptor subunit TctC
MARGPQHWERFGAGVIRASRKAFNSAWRRSVAVALALPLAGLVSEAAHAQGAAEKYPARAVRLVVGFAPGGGNDIMARIIGERLAKAFGQPFVVENKPGAGGALAASHVMAQAPDGYTLLVGASGAMSIGPAVYTKMPYDTLRDFAPVSLLATFPLVILANAEGPIKSITDLVAWTKANPAAANYASSSPAFTLGIELLKLKTGAPLQRVSYRSTNEGVVAVLTGQTTTTLVDTLPAMSLVQDGKLRALAVTSAARVPELPDVPTLAEAGVPGIEITLWTGLFAPSGTPPDVLTRLETEMKAIMRDAQVRERLRTLAADAVGSTAAEFASRIKADIERWTEVANAAQVKIDP